MIKVRLHDGIKVEEYPDASFWNVEYGVLSIHQNFYTCDTNERRYSHSRVVACYGNGWEKVW